MWKVKAAIAASCIYTICRVLSIVNALIISSGTLSSVSVGSISTSSLTISFMLDSVSQNYTISYSNNDCPNDIYDDIIAITGTMYTLTDLEEGTNYSLTVTSTLRDGGTGEYSLTATTITAG